MGNLLSSPSLVYIPAFANIVSIRTYPVVPTELSSGQQYVRDNFPVSDCLLNSRISNPTPAQNSTEGSTEFNRAKNQGD